jgi:UDP-N-acetyl-D-mannosaminuronic acid dehydrogenase
MPKVTAHRTAFETPWFQLFEKTVNGMPGLPDGAKFYSLKPQDYVSVIAVTTDGELVLCKQFRPAVEEFTIEFPSGLLEDGERPEETAKRELLEETGYQVDEVEYLGCLVPDTGRLANRMWCYFAKGARKVSEGGDASEGVEPLVLTPGELTEAIRSGTFSHALHLAALYMASAHGKLDLKTMPEPRAKVVKTKGGVEISPNGRSADRVADVCIIGGAGHVGLPLSLVLASKGLKVMIYDLNKAGMERIRAGEMPFLEKDSEPLLRQALADDRLVFTSDAQDVTGTPVVIVTIGTPVDEFLNPDTKVIRNWVDSFMPFVTDDQLLILRSTLYPGTTDWLHRYLQSHGKNPRIAFCPERIVQGFAIDELTRLPQIVSGTTPAAEEAAAEFWERLAPEVVRVAPIEAEFAKLFCNAYRYIQFAASNQFYMITSAAGVDYNRVVQCLKKNYSRMRDFPKAGFAAGPCLLKDTMQLAAFAQNDFPLGHSAMLVNEGLVLFLVGQLEKRFPLAKMRVGLLGMAFKSDSDDIRSSLSYKLKKLLQFRAAEVLTTDPFVTCDPELLPLDDVVAQSDLLILCTPHREYLGVNYGDKPIVDVWGMIEGGELIRYGVEG